ncbi:MAG TPA: hypothetical protein VFS60_01745 [Thermoanaerobaculia bacterium]|nr:hypothetical protein [Thermoanaerobaculia bacterium]
MWLFPSRAQWASWSLPSKLTAVGAYSGIIGIPLAIGLFALSAWSQERDALQAQRTSETLSNQSTGSRPFSPETQDATATTAASAASRPNVQSLALHDLLADLNREDLSDLQREQMRTRLTGKRVTWRVYVRQVTRVFGGSLLLLFVPPSQQSDAFPDILSATFPAIREPSLSAVRPGDLAVIEGSLSFRPWGLSRWLPTLEDAELLSFSTPSKSD